MSRPDRRAAGFAALAGIGLLAGLSAWAPPAAATDLDYSKPWIMPFDVDQRFPASNKTGIESQRQVYDFMWKTFVAINWPQKTNGKRAEPDSSASLAPWADTDQSEGPVVWQSYRRPNEVFVDPDDWPINWNSPPKGPLVVCPEANTFGLPVMTISAHGTNYSDYSDGVNQPYIQANYPTGPVTDQNGHFLRYEVGINRSYFKYVGHYRYYDADIQDPAVQNYIAFADKKGKRPPIQFKRNAKYFQALPGGTERYLLGFPDYARQGIAEWKAAWKVLDGDDVEERFYRRWAFFLNPDGSCEGPVKVGLVALHIHRVTPDLGHIGTTFEQVDNTTLQREYSSAKVNGAADLPAHASLNPGTRNNPDDYPNGYEICNRRGENCEAGIGGNLLPSIMDGEALPDRPKISNVSRQVPIPDDVADVNAEWRKRLKGSVFFYYQMIGAQNRNIDEPNPNLGPGTRGAQVSSTNNLINAALESYTQAGWSCALCHQNAFPQGVTLPLPSFGPAYDPLHTISFLLQNAQRSSD